MAKLKHFKVRLRRTQQPPCSACINPLSRKMWKLMRGKTISVSSEKFVCRPWCDSGNYLCVTDPKAIAARERFTRGLEIVPDYAKFFICGHLYLKVASK